MSQIIEILVIYITITSVISIPSGTIINSMDWYETSPSSSPNVPNYFLVTELQITKWTNFALKFFEFRRCAQVNIASEDECFRLDSLQKSQIALYIGYDRKGVTNNRILLDYNSNNNNNNNVVSTIISDNESFIKKRQELLTLTLIKKSVMGQSGTSSTNNNNANEQLVNRRKVVPILPDSTNSKVNGEHDVILVLDPYPYANFGHLIALFYIDLNIDGKNCKGQNQIFASDGTCITAARKPRCPNRLEKHTSGYYPRRCHMDFIPTVHISPSEASSTNNGNNNGASTAAADNSNNNVDLMECINIPGFASCPLLRPIQDTETILCDVSQTNTKRCETSHSGVGTRCKLFQTCDRGILIGGGWNRIHSTIQSYNNIISIETMLQRIGFLKENIKTFYANGGTPGIQFPLPGTIPRFYSTAMKTGIRAHLRTICETKHCGDSLFIYLNNPTTINGDMLLWDVDGNGIASELDIYTTTEFLSDISNCETNRIIIVADQSNTDILMSLLKDSAEHQNVILITAGIHSQITSNGELTNIWSNRTHSLSCIQHIYQSAVLKMKDSTPEFYDSSQINSYKLSLIGAPCDLSPGLTSKELRTLYQGCQNVPTSVWFSLKFGELSDEDEDLTQNSKESDSNVSGSRRTQ